MLQWQHVAWLRMDTNQCREWDHMSRSSDGPESEQAVQQWAQLQVWPRPGDRSKCPGPNWGARLDMFPCQNDSIWTKGEWLGLVNLMGTSEMCGDCFAPQSLKAQWTQIPAVVPESRWSGLETYGSLCLYLAVVLVWLEGASLSGFGNKMKLTC